MADQIANGKMTHNDMEKRLTVGFDAKRIVSNATGLGSYGRTLVNDLGRQEDLTLRLYAPAKGQEALRRQVTERPNVSFVYPRHSHTAIGKALWRSHGVVRQLRADGVQVYHGLSGELPTGLAKAGIASVVTIHDLIFLRHPEYYKRLDVAIYRQKFLQAVRQADRIVAISECTRKDICQLADVDPDRVDLIYQSCAPRFTTQPDTRLLWQVRDRYHLPDRYLLAVGSIEERKNMLLAVKALARLPEEVTLVMAGRYTPYVERICQYIDERRLYQRVKILHGVANEELHALYAMAEGFVYPSRYEGFGIPVIEAIRMGLPVVACKGSCLEEAGGPDSLYVDPDDDEAMAHAISCVLSGAPGRQQRIERSRLYVRRFDNTGAAQRFAQMYRDLAASKEPTA